MFNKDFLSWEYENGFQLIIISEIYMIALKFLVKNRLSKDIF